jgi:hypothetical protein
MMAAQMDSFFMCLLQEGQDEGKWLKRQGREIDRHVESSTGLCQGWPSMGINGGERILPARMIEMRLREGR